MMKRLICALLGAVMLFGAVACSPAAEPEVSTDSPASERALLFGLHQIYEGMPRVESIYDPNLNFKTTPDKWRPRN